MAWRKRTRELEEYSSPLKADLFWISIALVKSLTSAQLGSFHETRERGLGTRVIQADRTWPAGVGSGLSHDAPWAAFNHLRQSKGNAL